MVIRRSHAARDQPTHQPESTVYLLETRDFLSTAEGGLRIASHTAEDYDLCWMRKV
jgi:hypothetical protein